MGGGGGCGGCVYWEVGGVWEVWLWEGVCYGGVFMLGFWWVYGVWCICVDGIIFSEDDFEGFW